MSIPEKSAVATSSTTTSVPFHGSVEPAERAEAKKRIVSTGKFRSSKIVRITRPTWPVAPTTATVKPAIFSLSLCKYAFSAARASVDNGLGNFGVHAESGVDNCNRAV